MPTIDLTFPRRWFAEILPARPLILPPRHFVYPRDAEEVERGALELLVRPLLSMEADSVVATASGLGFSHAEPALKKKAGVSAPAGQPILMTCALGFRDPAAPTGLWSTPKPEELCAVSGGYAYIIDTTDPARFTMLPYRPVLEVRPAPAHNLLLFVGHHRILAWGSSGQAWESPKLSDEGITLGEIKGDTLHGTGWNLMTDRDTPFALDLRTGELTS